MSKANVVKLAAVASILGGVAVVLLVRQGSRLPQLGDAAPDFTLPALQGGNVRLSDYRRRVVVLNLWATWCPPCVEETPSLKKFADQMSGRGVAVLSISVDEDAGALADFVARYGLTYPVARDPGQTVTSRYGTFKFPETFVLDEDGRIADKFIGAVDWQDPRIREFVLNLAHAPAL